MEDWKVLGSELLFGIAGEWGLLGGHMVIVIYNLYTRYRFVLLLKSLSLIKIQWIIKYQWEVTISTIRYSFCHSLPNSDYRHWHFPRMSDTVDHGNCICHLPVFPEWTLCRTCLFGSPASETGTSDWPNLGHMTVF